MWKGFEIRFSVAYILKRFVRSDATTVVEVG